VFYKKSNAAIINIFMDLDTNIKLLPVNECSNAKMIIYMLYNKVTKKAYIGKTKHGWVIRRKTYEYDIKNPKKQSLILRSLRKHGWNNFLIAVLEENVSDLKLLSETEKQYIKKYNTNVNGYNMTTGGDGGCSVTAARNNSKRMKQQVKNGTFILQTPAIKIKANKAASKANKALYASGKSNLLWPEVKAKRLQSYLLNNSHPLAITIKKIDNTTIKKQYKCRNDAIRDGMTQTILDKLKVLNSYTVQRKSKNYNKGDIITIKYL